MIDHTADFISFGDHLADDQDQSAHLQRKPDQLLNGGEQMDGGAEMAPESTAAAQDPLEAKMLGAHKHYLEKMLYELPPWIKKDPSFCLS